eukprot:TRINITY_DN124084_c0_g1_i1.p1 TRINITY_DN124084_c0_g1~~TRINITY_DN124084_c0_g1_i1.p1  ORF type:complete len:246 (-),score=61.01 TRINITY_DN124084_c0_g1_i1:210-947(-)
MAAAAATAETMAARMAAVQKAELNGDYMIGLARTSGLESVGVVVVPMSNKTYKVLEIKEEGLIPDWNKAHERTPFLLVKEKDIILAVNGVSGNVKEMMLEFQQESIHCLMKHGKPDDEVGGIEDGAAAEPQLAAVQPAEAEEQAEAAESVATEAADVAATKTAVESDAETASAISQDDTLRLPLDAPEPSLHKGLMPRTNEMTVGSVPKEMLAICDDLQDVANAEEEMWPPGREAGRGCRPYCAC